MKLGVQMLVTGYTIDPVTLAKAVEDSAFDSFWAPEHATLPAHPVTPFPMTGGPIPAVYGQMADPFVLLGMMAAVTTRLKLATGVCLVPEHHPLLLAKSVSTLDNFSGGRFLFGIGTGWLGELTPLFTEHAATPWKYTAESVASMKRLWEGLDEGYDGTLLHFPALVCDPVPVQRPHPPIVVGAQGTARAFERIAAWGDGWIAMGVTPDQVAAGRRGLSEACERAGRDPADIQISVGVRDATPAIQHAYEDAGADRLIVLLYNHPGGPLPMEDWAQAGVEGLTAPPPTPEKTLRALEDVATRSKL